MLLLRNICPKIVERSENSGDLFLLGDKVENDERVFALFWPGETVFRQDYILRTILLIFDIIYYLLKFT